jgi:MSHA biogenesis protein MshL
MTSNPYFYVRFFIFIAWALLLTSCDHQAKIAIPTDLFSDTKPKAQPTAQKQPSKVQPPLTHTPVKPLKKFFNVSVHNIEAREFFMGLVMDSNENIVVHPEVSGVLSLELKNVTLADVINVVKKVYGYDYEQTDMGYIIYPSTMHTRTFKVDRLDLIREGRSNTNVTSGQNSQGNNNSQQGGNNQGINNNQGNINQQGYNSGQNYNGGQSSQMPSSSIRTTTSSDFWKELDETLQAIIAVDPQASVTINQQSGVVVARAKPMQLHEIENFLGTMQNQIARQVILEAKIVEVLLDDSHQDGVNWVVMSQNAALFTGFGTANPSTFTAIFANGDFAAMVKLLETQGKTNILSSPKISTLNNQNAIIKVGRDEYFVTGVYANTSSNVSTLTGVNNSSPPTPVMSSFFSGIALNVTPQIDDSNNVTLYIHPSITRVENLEKTFTIYGENYSIPTALNTVRESDSIVKAQDGQVVVLGGLMQETATENKEGVTGLATIPYIGHLFRVDEGKTQKSELIILLKASIINSKSDWQDNLAPSKQHYDQLEAKPMWK